jgi:DNA polymerase-1
MPKSNPVLYLIDASSYVYRAFHALPPLTSPGGIPTNAVFGLSTMLLKLLKTTAPTYLAAVFDAPGPTFRDELYADYKAHRPAMPDELALQFPLVHEIVAGFSIYDVALRGVEADDVIATIATHMAKQGADTVIITSDKDLMQLVGDGVRLWDTMRDRWYDAAAVRQRFGVDPGQIVELIGLMGDAVDNIPGVRGIGEKTATALIQTFGTIDNVLANLDSVATLSQIRGAKKVADLLRAQAAEARLSRQLALVRRDLALDCDLELFRFRGPDPERLRPIFSRLGFQRLLKDVARSVPQTAVTLRRVDDEAAAMGLVDAARRAGRLSFACDHDGEQPRGLICATEGLASVYVPLGAAVVEAVIVALLEDPQVEKVAHDLKRDLHALASVVSRIEPAFDVMVASYLLEASATHRLEDIAADVLDANLAPFRTSSETMATGVSLLLALKDTFRQELRERGLGWLFDEVEMPLVGVLSRMERRGVQLDIDALAVLGREMEERAGTLVDEIYELAGGEFNIASPPQLREVLFERLRLPTKGVRRGKTGLSTDADVLTRLSAAHALPAKILEYRALTKLKSTYVDVLPAAVNPLTGRLHTSFNQTVAATGRLSSSDPNLQNIPIRGVEGQRIRSAFVAPPGRLLLVADYSQIELRVLAHLSSDPVLVAAFAADEDIHARTAAEVFGVLPGTVTRDMRRVAKVINFGIIYGMGSQALARELGVSVAEADLYITNYFTRYDGVRAYLKATCDEAHRRGYVTTLFGRRRSLPDLASRERHVVQAAERTAANTPIQGSAADLIKLAMVRIDDRLAGQGLDAVMILQVHDELIFEVAEAAAEAVADLVRKEMEGVFSLKVPLKIELGVGKNWAEAH